MNITSEEYISNSTTCAFFAFQDLLKRTEWRRQALKDRCAVLSELKLKEATLNGQINS